MREDFETQESRLKIQAGEQGATLIYSMDAQFNMADPNEGRLPWNHFGDELWAEDMG